MDKIDNYKGYEIIRYKNDTNGQIQIINNRHSTYIYYRIKYNAFRMN